MPQTEAKQDGEMAKTPPAIEYLNNLRQRLAAVSCSKPCQDVLDGAYCTPAICHKDQNVKLQL